VDFDVDGTPANKVAADKLTPIQPYAQRAFTYLIDWVERRNQPPRSQTVFTDPVDDVIDPDQLAWW
jgi:hypothetical protein